ncbi:protein FAM90A27P-like [Balaenoptera acutorostrata]|uniref:Protein FAM90A27P-like n=1 Tax=Balaenoptera acutorostrata TaxID=9767 RepID=A0ABM3SKN5_BALAC|nr:protein FAM90A27P-like [Balaenoptera acutorostrata]
MTEKWVVDAAVEVLLRFPLLPGEDPSARCVPIKKCRPSVVQPHRASQRPGVQEERKLNSQFPRKNDQKPKDMRQIKGHNIHNPPQRPPTAQNVKPLQREPVGQKTPFSGEKGTKVKCRNCGAFGHLAISKWCPMKSWGGALAPQPSGSNKKENLKPKNPQDLQTPGSVNTAAREKEPELRQEERQRNPLPQTCPGRRQEKRKRPWKESVESCAFVRHPTQPMPVQTSRRRSVLGPVLTGQPPVKNPNRR